MLEENMKAYSEQIKPCEIDKKIIVEWECPKCKQHLMLNAENWENHVVYDTHNMDHEGIQCKCGYVEELYDRKVQCEVISDSSKKGYLTTDGMYVYVLSDGQGVRIT